MSNKTKRLIIIIVLLLTIISVAVAFYIVDSKYKEELALVQVNCQQQISSLQSELNSKKIQVHVPINDIQAGQVISPDMLEEVTIFSDSDPNAFLDVAALTSDNEEAVESLRRYLEGEREQNYEEDELYEEYEEYLEDDSEIVDPEEVSDESEEVSDDTEVSNESEEISKEIRMSVGVMSSVEGTDVPETAVEGTEDVTEIEGAEEILEIDEIVDSISNDVGELTGIIAVTDLPAGQPIYKTAVQIMDCEDLREKFINFVTLNTNLSDGSTVDIRIKFPNGEDYVVLSKEVLRDLNLAGGEFYLWVNEESILRLSAATVDAAINGGEIYVTRYVKPSIQDPLVYTYQPPEDVLRLIQWDPNIILEAENTYSASKRSEFETRLQAFLSKDLDTNGDISATVTN